MKTKLPVITATVIFVVMSIGLIVGLPIGTLSGFGWSTISVLCPIGAITTMISSHTIIPRGVISVVLMIVAFIVLGRFFCGWMCPVPLWTRVKNFFKSSKTRKKIQAERNEEAVDIASYDLGLTDTCAACGACSKGKGKGVAGGAAGGAGGAASGAGALASVKPQKPAKFDSRHIMLIGAIVSTLIFGFPVFCVVCPIGLSFAVVLLTFRMFAFGDVTVNILIALALIILEIFVLKKWCNHICPISGFMTLFTRFNKTVLPTIDNEKCLETTTGKPCSRCASVCDAGINLRHPDFGEASLKDCVRCRACVEVCPTSAISMPIFAGAAGNGSGSAPKFRSTGAIPWPASLAGSSASADTADSVASVASAVAEENVSRETLVEEVAVDVADAASGVEVAASDVEVAAEVVDVTDSTSATDEGNQAASEDA